LAAVFPAREALRAGQPARALALLDDHDRQFPRGELGVEVELLRIEALSLSGATGEARTRAERFIALHPDSPYAQRARVHVGTSERSSP
jgi:outer membrane protein assembly factor BamD (BamD/ComL family)